MKISATLLFLIVAMVAADPAMAKGRFAPDARSTAKALSDCNAFISYDEIRTLFEVMARDDADLASTFTVGVSFEGWEIFGLRLSASPAEGYVGPKVRIIGGIHGNECMAVQLVVDFAEWMIDNYADDPFVTRLLDETEVVLVPIVNPDGYIGELATRYNGNGVDLNRNFHFAWIGGGVAPFSEPETRAIRNMSDATNFTVGLSYHTAAAYVNAPWNYSPYHPPDEALFQAMGEAYAGTSSYNVVFGWDWYNIEGDVNDWSLGTHGTFDWTLELMSDLDPQWPTHFAGLEGFLSFVFQGIGGQVRDRETGDPLHARIEVTPEGAPVFTHPEKGDYHRVLLPGRYDITATAVGYAASTRTGVEVTEDDVTAVDFELEPLVGERTRFAFSVNGMTLPEPVNRSAYDTGPYLNSTMVWNAIGAPDQLVYSLSPAGSITLDMGDAGWVDDIEGADLWIVSGDMAGDEEVTVLVAESQDGPFEAVGYGSGSLEVDIAPSGFDSIRFVRLVDESDGLFNDENPGYDLDAVVNLAGGGYTLPDGGVADGGDGRDTDTADGGDVGTWRATAWGCECRGTGGARRGGTGLAMLRALLGLEMLE